MAIVIPSKHIFEKDNDKVRDNKIDKVEINAVEISPDNKYNTSVYNEKITEVNYNTWESTDKSDKGIVSRNNIGNTSCNYEVGYAKVLVSKTYTTFDVSFNDQSIKYSIVKVLDKTDKDGNANIKYSMYCDKTFGKITGKVDIPVMVIHNSIAINENESIFPTVQEEKGNIEYNVAVTPKDKYEVTETLYPDKLYKKEITASVALNDTKTNLGKLDISHKDGKYSCTCTVLCGLNTYYFSGKKENSYTYDTSSGAADETYFAETVELQGEYEDCTPSYIEITFYGNTIGIDMNDKTITINGGGTHPISFEGNELMQTTNYVMDGGTSKDQLTTAFGKTMNLYENGKETATITCDIHDVEYYNVEKNLSVEKQEAQRVFKDFHTTKLEDRGDDDYYYARFDNLSVGAGFDAITINGIENSTIVGTPTIDLATGTFTCYVKVSKDAESAAILVVGDKKEKIKSVNLHLKCNAADGIDLYKRLNGDDTDESITINGVKLYVSDYDEEFLSAYANDLTATQYQSLQRGVDNLRFKRIHYEVGDIVIPMVYGANGADKPMSKYSNGTAKQFQVQGVRVYYDGAVWQELTLQEFSQ